jgi:hypothetical protein
MVINEKYFWFKQFIGLSSMTLGANALREMAVSSVGLGMFPYCTSSASFSGDRVKGNISPGSTVQSG